MDYIQNMLYEGYELKAISVGGKKYVGGLVKNIDILKDHICVELEIGEILFAPLNKIDYIILKEEEEE